MTAIAVVVPCHDAAEYVGDALASVAAQTRAATEVVVVDDGSTDGSGDIARQAGVRVVRHATPRGNAAARNAGVAVTTAPLIAFLDADDAWHPGHLETLGGLLDRWAEAGAAFASCEVFGAATGLHRGFLPEGPPQDAFEGCLQWWVGQPTGCMVRRAALARAGGFDETYPVAVDFDCWLRLARVAPFVASHAVTGRYRRHAAQISADARRQATWCWRARHAMRERLVAEGDPRAARATAVLRDFWDGSCRRAWDAGDLDELRFLVSVTPPWMTGDPARRRWRARQWLPAPLVHWWHGSGSGAAWQRLRRGSGRG